MLNKKIIVVLFVSLLVFSRLIVADDSISFDRVHYINFIEEMQLVGLSEFWNRLVASFPYVTWANFGKFEFGFSTLIFILSKTMASGTLWALLAALSFFIIFAVLSADRASWFAMIPLMVISLTLLQTNALRVSLGLSIFMVALQQYLSRHSYKSLLIFAISITFHLSLLLPFILILIALTFEKLRFSFLGIFASVIFCALFVGNFQFLAGLIGGKLQDYYIQAAYYNTYTGASGLNIVSLIFLISCFVFYRNYKYDKSFETVEDLMMMQRANILGILLSSVVFVLIYFGGIYAVIGDRISQMAIFMIIFLLYRGRIKAGNYGILLIALAYYAFVNLLLRYPQSNFFYPLTQHADLMLPVLY